MIEDRSDHSMNTRHTQFVGSIPEIYDGHLGPLFFEFSAADLAGRVSAAVPEGGRVLEVACGTGISTEHLRRALPATADILATDLNEAMVEFARAKRGALARVAFQPAGSQQRQVLLRAQKAGLLVLSLWRDELPSWIALTSESSSRSTLVTISLMLMWFIKPVIFTSVYRALSSWLSG